MPISVECRFCGKAMLIADEVAGKHFRCPGCREIIEAPPRAIGIASRVQATAIVNQDSKKNAAPPRRHAGDTPETESAGRSTRNTQRARTDKQRDAIAEIWSVSSYDYEEVRQPKKEKKATPNLRARHPEAFAEYDRVVNECLIFLIGLGVIIAALFSLFYFTDTRSDRALRLYQGALAVAGGCVFSGLLCLTRWRAMLIIVAVLSAIFGTAIAVLGFAVHIVAMLPGIGMCIVCVKLFSAIQLHPSSQG